MFDIGWSELLLTGMVGLVVIGPRDLPRAMRAVAGIIRKLRRMSEHVHSGFESLIHEADLQDSHAALKGKIEDLHPRNFMRPLSDLPSVINPENTVPASETKMITDKEADGGS